MISTAVTFLNGHSSAEVLYLNFPNATRYMHRVLNANMMRFSKSFIPNTDAFVKRNEERSRSDSSELQRAYVLANGALEGRLAWREGDKTHQSHDQKPYRADESEQR